MCSESEYIWKTAPGYTHMISSQDSVIQKEFSKMSKDSSKTNDSTNTQKLKNKKSKNLKTHLENSTSLARVTNSIKYCKK